MIAAPSSEVTPKLHHSLPEIPRVVSLHDMDDFWQRHLSWNRRFGRVDFAISLAVVWVGAIVLNQIFHRPWESIPPAGKLLYWLFIAYLVLAASKRCRDVDTEPWVAILMVAIAPLMLYLLFGKGTQGRNKYGEPPKAIKL